MSPNLGLLSSDRQIPPLIPRVHNARRVDFRAFGLRTTTLFGDNPKIVTFLGGTAPIQLLNFADVCLVVATVLFALTSSDALFTFTLLVLPEIRDDTSLINCPLSRPGLSSNVSDD